MGRVSWYVGEVEGRGLVELEGIFGMNYQLFVLPLPGEIIQFDLYFSNGLKPPTRLSLDIQSPSSSHTLSCTYVGL